MLIPFAEWAPDRWGLNDATTAGEASGVLPKLRSYGPWPQLAAGSLALAADCKGAIAVRGSSGSTVIFAGTATKLYKFAGIATAWTDVTRSAGGDYAVPADGRWSFAQFDKYLIACNGVDANQYIDIDSGTNFAALTGSPIARYCKTVGDFLMLFDLATAQGPSTSGRIQVAWSGARNPLYWTFGQKSSDYATFWDGGFVTGGTSILGGLVFQAHAVNRMVRRTQGAPVFDFAPIEEMQGTRAPYSIVSHEQETAFYSDDGFNVIGPGGVRNIGLQRVDEWFRDTVNQSRIPEIVGALDPISMRRMWLFPTGSNSSDVFDHVLCHDERLDRWTHAAISGTHIFSAASVGTTLDDLTTLYSTLDAVPYPLDSAIWQGGVPALAMFDSVSKMSFFAGTPMAATIQTTAFEPIPGKRALCTGFRLVGGTSAAQGRISAKERTADSETWGASATVNAQGLIETRVSGRILRAEVTEAAGADWDHIAGIDTGDPSEELIVEDGER